MLINWKELTGELQKGWGRFRQVNKEAVDGFQALQAVKNSYTALDPKTRELIALAVAVTTQCEGCIAAHVNAAHKAGVTQRELSEALSMAINLNAGAAWVSSLKVLEAYEALTPAAA